MGSTAPIFICGEGRSGTKLLRDTLGKLESIYFFRCESYIFVRSDLYGIKHLEHTLQTGELKNKIAAVLTCMLAKNKKEAAQSIKDQGFNEDTLNYTKQVLDKYQESELSDRISIFKAATATLKESNNKKRWLEKTPMHIYHCNEILKEFPEAKIIISYRDPRAVIASWLKKDPNKTILGLAFAWNKVTKEILKLKKLASNNLFFIRYEDLIIEPELQLKNLCNFLEEDFSKKLLDVKVVNSKSDKGQQGFNRDAVERWQSSLTEDQIKIIDFYTQELRNKLDYADFCNEQSLLQITPIIIKEYLRLVQKKFFKLLDWFRN